MPVLSQIKFSTPRVGGLFCVVLLFLVSGCLPTKDKETKVSGPGGPKGDAEPFLGAFATLENSGLSCSVSPTSATSADIHCQVTVRSSGGEEKSASAIGVGLESIWKAPEIVGGRNALRNLSCRTAESALSQVCRAEWGEEATPLVLRFENQIYRRSDGVAAAHQEEVSLLHATSFGRVLHFRNSRIDDGEVVSEFLKFPRLAGGFGSPLSVCSQGEDVYFATSQYLYRVRKGEVSLYAGHPSPANHNTLSSRLLINLAGTDSPPQGHISYEYPSISCRPEGVIVADAARSRVLLIAEDGPVRVLVNQGISPLFATFYPNAATVLAVERNGTVWSVEVASQKRTELAQLPSALLAAHLAGQSLYVASATAVYEYNLAHGTQRRLAGAVAASGASPQGTVAGEALFHRITGLTTIGQTLFLSDSENSRVVSFSLQDPNSPTAVVFEAGAQIAGCTATPPSTETLCKPWGLAPFENSKLLVADTATGSVWLKGIVPSSAAAPFVGTGTPIAIGTQVESFASEVHFGPALGVHFENPENLLVAEPLLNQLTRINLKEGRFTRTRPGNIALPRSRDFTKLRTGALLLATAHGAHRLEANLRPASFIGAPSARQEPGIVSALFDFRQATAVAEGLAGDVFVATQSPAAVYRIDATTQLVSKILGDELLRSPESLAIDPFGNLLVADPVKRSVYRVSVGTFEVSRVIGNESYGQPQDGSWADATGFGSPRSLRIRSNGEIFLADTENGSIYVLTPHGASQAPRYKVRSLFPRTEQTYHCSASFSETVSPGTPDRYQASLSKLCNGSPLALDVSDTCGVPGGRLRLAYSQTFGATWRRWFANTAAPGNVVVIDMPCH